MHAFPQALDDDLRAKLERFDAHERRWIEEGSL
jgi:hypothetical protein